MTSLASLEQDHRGVFDLLITKNPAEWHYMLRGCSSGMSQGLTAMWIEGVGEGTADLTQDLPGREVVRPGVGGLQQRRERRMLASMGDSSPR